MITGNFSTQEGNVTKKSPITTKQSERSIRGKKSSEAEPVSLELPLDFQVGKFHSYGRGNYTIISGTFDGRYIELCKSANMGLSVSADGKRVSTDEAESLWEKIYPAALKVYDAQQAQQADEREKRQVKASERRKNIELSHKLRASWEDTKEKPIRVLLHKALEKIELNEDDREFIEETIDRIAKLVVMQGQENAQNNINIAIYNVLQIRNHDFEGKLMTMSEHDKYKRRRSLLYKLLGVDSTKAQVWEAGFVNTYIHSKVFDTIFPDIIVREEYERDGSQIHIEKNSRFAKKN